MIVSARSRPTIIALGDVLQHAVQVHALPRAGGCDLAGLRERRDVADLVEREGSAGSISRPVFAVR
jgi:hypothetical protein